MRRLLTLLLLSIPGSVYAAAPQTAVLDLRNMTCAVRSITVHKALEKVPGVIAAEVDCDRKTATVRYDGDKTSPAALVNATTNAGFPSTVHNGASKQ
jgi:mercuric ion binding protein